ncbi:MAG: 5-(carboxyamino)imidazole ribonucleotide mutase [Sphaerochaeta sp.]
MQTNIRSLKSVAVIMGSDSDLAVMEKAIDVLKVLSIPFDVHILSAHRTPVQAAEFASQAQDNGYGVFIAAAGKAAHLAGILAAHTILPVIGVPIDASLGGMDALLSTVQMPTGIPVATVAINGAANAALLAAQILALGNDELGQKLQQKRRSGEETVLEKNRKIEQSFTL